MIDINKLRVASPCSVGWETMTGDERARHCESCKMNVYNIAGMTNTEVQQLVSNREGRLCIRLFRRSDGTVLTKDCPVGFRTYQKRIAKFAGATLSVLFSFVSVGLGQNDKAMLKKDNVKTERKEADIGLSGTIMDPHGAVIPDATIRLFAGDYKKPLRTTKSSEIGVYNFSSIAAGTYRLEIRKDFFKTHVVKNILVKKRQTSHVNVNLEVADGSVVVGIIMEEPLIDMSSSSVKSTITRR